MQDVQCESVTRAGWSREEAAAVEQRIATVLGEAWHGRAQAQRAAEGRRRWAFVPPEHEMSGIERQLCRIAEILASRESKAAAVTVGRRTVDRAARPPVIPLGDSHG